MGVFLAADPETVAATLEQIRQQRCHYGPNATTCDCKYANIGSHGRPLGQGEASGCAELRQAIWAVREVGKRQVDEADIAHQLRVERFVLDLQVMFRDLDNGRLFIEDFDPALLHRLRVALKVQAQ